MRDQLRGISHRIIDEALPYPGTTAAEQYIAPLPEYLQIPDEPTDAQAKARAELARRVAAGESRSSRAIRRLTFKAAGSAWTGDAPIRPTTEHLAFYRGKA